MADVRIYIVYNKEVIQLPVNPPELSVKNAGNNQTIDLVKLGEVNLLKKPKLTEFSFESFFPVVITGVKTLPPYVASETVQEPDYYVNLFQKIKNEMNPIQFIISGYYSDGAAFNEFVSVEDFDHKLTAHGDIDYTMSIKIYQPYSSKILDAKGKVVSQSRVMTKVIPPTYTVKKDGESLVNIGKQQLGTGSGFQNIANVNKIFDPAKNLAKGTVLKMPSLTNLASGLNNAARFVGINTNTLTLNQIQQMATGGLSVSSLVTLKLDTIKNRAIVNFRNIPVSKINEMNLPATITQGLL